MPRVNERCIEHTPDEYRLNNVDVAPGAEVLGTAQDLNGAKVHCCWIKVDKAGCKVTFDYLSRLADTVLEENGPHDLKPGTYTRFQFGTYRQDLLLPVMQLRIRVTNGSGEVVRLTAYGMSQLQ